MLTNTFGLQLKSILLFAEALGYELNEQHVFEHNTRAPIRFYTMAFWHNGYGTMYRTRHNGNRTEFMNEMARKYQFTVDQFENAFAAKLVVCSKVFRSNKTMELKCPSMLVILMDKKADLYTLAKYL